MAELSKGKPVSLEVTIDWLLVRGRNKNYRRSASLVVPLNIQFNFRANKVDQLRGSQPSLSGGSAASISSPASLIKAPMETKRSPFWRPEARMWGKA
jgi:hypothetical protein